MATPINIKVLDAVESKTDSKAVDTMGHPYITLTNIGDTDADATVKLQGSPDGSNWVDLGSDTLSSEGTTIVEETGAFNYVRASVSAYTDGKITSYITLTGYAGIK